jgi:hypothetical protein
MPRINPDEYAQALLDNAIVGGSDQRVQQVVITAITELLQAYPPVNAPGGAIQQPQIIRFQNPPDQDDGSLDTDAAITAIRQVYTNQQAGSISLSFCSEAHDCQQDMLRARAICAAMDYQNAGRGVLVPTLSILERGMIEKYTVTFEAPNQPTSLAKEEELGVALDNVNNTTKDFGKGLTRKQRDLVLAGYIFLCVASGNQANTEKVFVIFGENHVYSTDQSDIPAQFEALARWPGLADWVQRRPRTILKIPSYVPMDPNAL